MALAQKFGISVTKNVLDAGEPLTLYCARTRLYCARTRLT
jgi:hypothetical protein